jgi:hypothetical protein
MGPCIIFYPRHLEGCFVGSLINKFGVVAFGIFFVAVDNKQGSKVLLEKKMGIVGTGKDRATWG